MMIDRDQPAAFAFRCRRCGVSYSGPRGPLANCEGVAIQLLSSGGKPVNVAGAAPVGTVELHGCPDGGRGFSDLTGIDLANCTLPAVWDDELFAIVTSRGRIVGLGLDESSAWAAARSWSGRQVGEMQVRGWEIRKLSEIPFKPRPSPVDEEGDNDNGG